MVVFDSSVVIKWFRKSEAFQEQALSLHQTYLNGSLTIYVPDLLIYELANVLRSKPDMNWTKVQQALHSFAVHSLADLIRWATHACFVSTL
ncbi:MAG: PIN domain-containing protein [candidate division NC10 bacterium]|nr:PIN domain-containing protein [candidate division NC10 bacterium]